MNKYDSKTEKSLKLYIKLARAYNGVTHSTHQHLRNVNLTHSQFAVLEALYHLGPSSQGDLSQKILKSNANVTTVVDSLEKKELVKRQRSELDRRRVEVHLTATGQQLIEKVFPTHAKTILRRFSALNQQQQEQLSELLEILGKG